MVNNDSRQLVTEEKIITNACISVNGKLHGVVNTAEHTETGEKLAVMLAYDDDSKKVERICATTYDNLMELLAKTRISITPKDYSNNKYRHFKDKWYIVLCIAERVEKKEKLVIYQALYGNHKIYARPYEMFMEAVPKEKENPTGQPYRFMSMKELEQ